MPLQTVAANCLPDLEHLALLPLLLMLLLRLLHADGAAGLESCVQLLVLQMLVLV